jgi:hypothetical protein
MFGTSAPAKKALFLALALFETGRSLEGGAAPAAPVAAKAQTAPHAHGVSKVLPAAGGAKRGLAEEGMKALPEHAEGAAGWWGDVPAAADKEDSDEHVLARMNALLRRQLDEGTMVFSYDVETEVPTAAPTGTPCPGAGEYRYYLALYDYGNDGWEGATYELFQYVGVRAGTQIADGTLSSGSEAIDEFCITNGLYALEYGGGSDDGEIGLQFLPDDVQMITPECTTEPCVFSFLAVDGLIVPPTGPPTASNFGQPTAYDASQLSWHIFGFEVNGFDAEGFSGSTAAFSTVAYTLNDVIPFIAGPESILEVTITDAATAQARKEALEAEHGRRLEDEQLSVEVTVEMNTCALAGHNSNDDCLDAMVEDVALAIVNGYMLERLIYWANYFGYDLGDDAEITGIREDPAPYWIMPNQPSPAPTQDASGKKSKKKSQPLKGDGLIILIVFLILAVLLMILAAIYFKQRERKATERKDSWDISTMFTDEQNLPPSGDMTAGAAGDEPQALQKITQAAEL